MKKNILFLAFISVLTVKSSYAQLMTFGFVKNCMSYARTTMTDELNKKHFSIVSRKVESAGNKLLDGATYYSNQKEKTDGEIRVLSQINDSKKITEISFVTGLQNDYSKNYEEVYNQMVSFFKDEKTFKSDKYNVPVNYFERDKIYYYTYENNKIPTIVISNYKLEKDYFGN